MRKSTGETPQLLTARDMAMKLANVGGIDRWAKYLQDWLDSYINRWKAEEAIWHAPKDAAPAPRVIHRWLRENGEKYLPYMTMHEDFDGIERLLAAFSLAAQPPSERERVIPPIPAYITPHRVSADGAYMIGMWGSGRAYWRFRAHDNHWCSEREATAEEIEWVALAAQGKEK